MRFQLLCAWIVSIPHLSIFSYICFTKTTDWGEYLEVKEEFAIAIKEIVEDKARTGFAFPSASIYVESLPGEVAEIFKPPNDN